MRHLSRKDQATNLKCLVLRALKLYNRRQVYQTDKIINLVYPKNNSQIILRAFASTVARRFTHFVRNRDAISINNCYLVITLPNLCQSHDHESMKRQTQGQRCSAGEFPGSGVCLQRSNNFKSGQPPIWMVDFWGGDGHGIFVDLRQEKVSAASCNWQ